MDWIRAISAVILAVAGVFLFIGIGAVATFIGTAIGIIAVILVIVMILATAIHQRLRQGQPKKR